MSGTICYLCLGSLTIDAAAVRKIGATACQGLIDRLKLFSQLFETETPTPEKVHLIMNLR